MQIEMMYHLNISHMTTSEVHGVITISYPLEKLAITIIEEKEKLKYFKMKSNSNMQQLKQVIKRYTPGEQKKSCIICSPMVRRLIMTSERLT